MANAAFALRSLAWVTITLGVLTSCGGGSSASNTPAPPPTLQSSALVGQSVPAAISSQISSIASYNGSAAPADTQLAVPTGTATGDSPVIATSQSGDVLLMAFVQPGQTPLLDAASTSIAYGRIALGPIAATPAVTAQVDAAILALPEYPNLLAAVTAALAAGTPPANSAAVLASLAILVTQGASALTPSIQTPASAGARPASVHSGRALPLGTTPPPLPYTLVPGAVNGAALSLSDDPGAGVKLSNYSLVYWTGYATSLAGAPLGSGVPLPPLDPINSLVAVASGSPIVTPVSVAGSGNQFVVGVRFDGAAQTASVAYLIANEASVILNSILPPPINVLSPCVGSSLSAAIGPAVSAAAAAPTGSTLNSFLSGLVNTPSSALNTLQAVAGCASKSLPVTAQNYLGSIFKVVSIIQLGVGTTQTYYGVKQFYAYLNQPQATVEICKSSGSDSVIISCALSIQPSQTYVAIGQNLQLSAVSAVGNPITTGVTWAVSPSSGSGAISSNTGLLTADFPGPFTVQARDQYGDVGSETFTSYVPTISPVNGSVNVGATLQMALVDPSGANSALSPLWTWTTSTPNYVSVDPSTGTVTGINQGTAQVSATDPTTGTVLPATTIQVTSSFTCPTAGTDSTLTVKQGLTLKSGSIVALSDVFDYCQGSPFYDDQLVLIPVTGQYSVSSPDAAYQGGLELGYGATVSGPARDSNSPPWTQLTLTVTAAPGAMITVQFYYQYFPCYTCYGVGFDTLYSGNILVTQ